MLGETFRECISTFELPGNHAKSGFNAYHICEGEQVREKNGEKNRKKK